MLTFGLGKVTEKWRKAGKREKVLTIFHAIKKVIIH